MRKFILFLLYPSGFLLGRGARVFYKKVTMSKIRVAINGFGRIGRRVLRASLKHPDIEIVAVNDLTPPEVMAHLFHYDSVHGNLEKSIRLENNVLFFGPHQIQLSAEKDPTQLPWKKLNVDLVFECTGIFTDKEKASLHLKAGSKRVLISAPSKDAEITICMGINHHQFNPQQHFIISNASCTTNCLAPVVKVIDDHYGVVRGLMTTVHSYTNDQNILDLPHKDLRRARAAALSQIPTTTGAAKAIGLVLPHLKGKLDGYAVRVPTPNVSLVDLTVELAKPTTKEELNTHFQNASEGALRGILGFSNAPLVSCDYNGCELSSTIDAELTTILGGNLAKVVAWYDNETGFSCRMLDVARFIGQNQ